MRYARIEQGTVVEFFETDGNISGMFHPSLVWVECPNVVVTEGWGYKDGVFTIPVPMEPPTPEPIIPTPRLIDANDVTIGQAERLYTAASDGEMSAMVLIELLDL